MATMVAVPVEQQLQGFSLIVGRAPGLTKLDATNRPARPRVSGTAGGRQFDEEIIREHSGMVHAIARKIHRTLPLHVDLDDLVAAGMLGLVDAAGRFKGDREVEFRSFAQFRVRGAILDSLRDLDWGSREQRRKGRAIESAVTAAARRLGRTPDHGEIAAEMGIELSRLQQTLADLKGLELGSLQAKRGENSEEEEVAYIAGAVTEEPLFRCLEGELRQRLADAIDALPERERLVITLYYYEELSMKEIGQVLGVVESRISQLRSSAVLRLRAALAELD